MACAGRGYGDPMAKQRGADDAGGFKNALPWEVESPRDDDEDPRPLHTQADKEPPLTRPEADVLGISPTPKVVYAETDEDQNRDDQRDAHRAEPDEHV
jgi:hypothetical protein